jgi:glycerophosphoryl diester phosphodiesterase
MGRAPWIAARPVAHRGLHDIAAGIVENTASAFQAAIDNGFAMECDVQISSDGEAVVFHDDTLDRLTSETGPVAGRTAAELGRIALHSGRDCIIRLGDLCDLVAAKMPLIVEIKASWSNDRRLERRVADVLKPYRGEVAVMSFDPHSTATMRSIAPQLIRGVVQESVYDDREWARLSRATKLALGHVAHLPWSRPDFLAWYVRDVDHRTPRLVRSLLRLPLLTWTVRTPAEQARAAVYADQMIFEGFHP